MSEQNVTFQKNRLAKIGKKQKKLRKQEKKKDGKKKVRRTKYH